MKMTHTLVCCSLLAILLGGVWPAVTRAAMRDEVDLSGGGWKIWHDDAAAWKDDDLYLPPVDLSRIPTNPPTGGWPVLETGKNAAIPGTAEEYLQKVPGPEGDIIGVTWWMRPVAIPASASPRRILLRFEAVRQRAEVYVNQKLVGYDMIGNTPFEVDLSNAAKPGDTVQLAVRVTDPGGNFDWHDKGLINWGKNQILFGHGFGGITGRIRLVSCDPVYVDDIYVQNTPAITDVNVEVTLRNTTEAAVRRDVVVSVLDRKNPAASPLVVQRQADVNVAPGTNVVKVKLSCPQARLWDPNNPNLYVCETQLVAGGQPNDAARQTFGFRWFEPVGIGTDAMFRLNGKRIVLRSAISWGFFPITGLIATNEIAERQIRVAREFGLNMLNFHRAIGQPVIFEKADEMGLLYYEEPGNYDNGADIRRLIPRAMAREKVLRMVKRDRSHPSLIIYCMSNETGPAEPALAVYAEDMKAMHALDPSRVITRSSGLRSALGIQNEISTKWHYRPFDDLFYKTGWYDDHHAGGPAVYTQDAYKNPNDYFHLIRDPQEINFWGEEGAISTPPRLGLIKEELSHESNLGWDGQTYLDWYKMFDDFINAKNLRAAFPTVDSLCKAMGNISIEHQGRTIQIIRLNNDSDGYCINGWESEILENHSGVVDCFRNPKGDPAIMAYYNQPLYIAVMPRNQVVQTTSKVLVDFYIINEKDVKGQHRLAITAADPTGKQVFTRTLDVTIKGGDVYGQLLAEAVEIPVAGTVGNLRIQAQVLDPAGAPCAAGRDDVFCVDWKSDKVTGTGAILDAGGRVRQFLTRQKGLQVADYADGLAHQDWVIATNAPNAAAPAVIPAARLLDPTGTKPGLVATFFTDKQFTKQAHKRVDETVDLYAPDGAPPDPAVAALGNYSVRWEGKLVPPATGAYTFSVQGTGTATVTIDGNEVPTGNRGAAPATGARRGGPFGRGGPAAAQGTGVHLVADKPVSVKVEWVQSTGNAECRLLWSVPANDVAPPSAQKLLQRVQSDGTTLIVLENAAAWLELAKTVSPEVKYSGSFIVGKAWAGGVHFVRAHPLFKGLPVNGPMDWPYQAVVRDGPARSGLLLEGDELAAGAFHANTPLSVPPTPIRLGTAVGVIRYGKGKIVVSTLDIAGNLTGPEGPPDVARKLLCNYIGYATTK
jgi:beta-galactosidase